MFSPDRIIRTVFDGLDTIHGMNMCNSTYPVSCTLPEAVRCFFQRQQHWCQGRRRQPVKFDTHTWWTEEILRAGLLLKKVAPPLLTSQHLEVQQHCCCTNLVVP